MMTLTAPEGQQRCDAAADGALPEQPQPHGRMHAEPPHQETRQEMLERLQAMMRLRHGGFRDREIEMIVDGARAAKYRILAE